MRATLGWTMTCLALVAMSSPLLIAQTQSDRRTVDLHLQQKIMELERQGWEAAKNRDSAAVQKLLTDDALDLGEYGIWGAKKSVESIASLEKHPSTTLAEYSVCDWNFRMPSENVVVIAYKVTLIGMSNNVRQSPAVQYFSTVWVREGNTWRALLYHDSTAPDKAKGCD